MSLLWLGRLGEVELVVVLMALAFYAPYVRGKHGLWFIDNVAALCLLSKGAVQQRNWI